VRNKAAYTIGPALRSAATICNVCRIARELL
jgi:hypothetical protein